MQELDGKKIALFVEDMYEDQELWYPYYRFKEAGAEVTLIGPETEKQYKSKHGYPAQAERSIDDVHADDFDALIIPGGYSPDHMRRNDQMVLFVKEMAQKQKPVAAICHAGWMLASAEIIDGRRVTSFPSIKDDMIHAGADWVDEEVVADENIITSRRPDDLPAFCREIIRHLTERSAEFEKSNVAGKEAATGKGAQVKTKGNQPQPARAQAGQVNPAKKGAQVQNQPSANMKARPEAMKAAQDNKAPATKAGASRNGKNKAGKIGKGNRPEPRARH